jgi:hypothetical protein
MNTEFIDLDSLFQGFFQQPAGTANPGDGGAPEVSAYINTRAYLALTLLIVNC